MTQSKSTDTQNRQSGSPSTEADAKASKEPSMDSDKTSGDHMSRQKAGSDHGAGGGAKQDQKHR